MPPWHVLCIPGVKSGKGGEAIDDLTWPSLIPWNKQMDGETALMDGGKSLESVWEKIILKVSYSRFNPDEERISFNQFTDF